MLDDAKMISLVVVGTVLILMVGVGIKIFITQQEANVFNKFTDGPKATFYDALFSNLRVEACRN